MMRSNKTYISSFTAGLAAGSDSHEVPFYRVNAPSLDDFIEEGSNGTRGRGHGNASTFRFFRRGESLLPSGHTRGVKNPGSSQKREKERRRGGGEWRRLATPVRDPGRPIRRYGYDYEKYGNSALKDVKWPGGGGLYRHVGTRHLWRSINVMYARRFCPGIEIGWRRETRGVAESQRTRLARGR